MSSKVTDLSVAADTLLSQGSCVCLRTLLALSGKSCFWTWLLLYLIVPCGRHTIRCNRECVCPWTRRSCLGHRIQSAFNLHPHLNYAHCDTAELSDIMGPPTSVHICQITEGARCSQLNKARTRFLCRKGAQQCRKYKEPDRSLSAPITFLLQ